MCLIAFALGPTPDTPLLLAANRDEFWDRPTLPLMAWRLPGGTDIWSGRDERAGGTWMGFSADGRVAMLTNVRAGPSVAAPCSRGELVTAWLAGPEQLPDLQAFTTRLDPHRYAGFNLVLGDLSQGHWHWLSNRPGLDAPTLQPLSLASGWWGAVLQPGLYGLSNAGLDTPWPKALRLKSAMTQAVAALHLQAPVPLTPLDAPPQHTTPHWQAPLLHALLDRQTAPDAELPRTGVSLEQERGLSSPFVHLHAAGYGTRSSLLAHARRHPHGRHSIDLHEWTHTPGSVAPATRGSAERWPLQHSVYRSCSIHTWGMPTSSNGAPTTA